MSDRLHDETASVVTSKSVEILIRGASEHNLRGIDVEIGDGLTVVTGVSGSGKTSLVFDTLYHEARRRFLEAFGSSTSRLSPARVKTLVGVGPTVGVGQNLLNRNPASTVATASGLHPFLRLLYARFAERFCPRCGSRLRVLSEDEMLDVLSKNRDPVFAALVRAGAGSHRTLLAFLSERLPEGSLYVDGKLWRGKALDPAENHDIEVEVAAAMRDAGVRLDIPVRARPKPSLASGVREDIPVRARLRPSMALERTFYRKLAALGASSFTIHAANGDLFLSRSSSCARCAAPVMPLEPVHFHTPCARCKGEGCDLCGGTGLMPEAAGARFSDKSLPALLGLTVSFLHRLFQNTSLPASAARLSDEISRRFAALEELGLGYITLDRRVPTLSRGEAQRLRLAVSLAGRLHDILHILDEPTVGLHPLDVKKVIPAFRRLKGPVIFVEHDRTASSFADTAVDIGPTAGARGGEVVFSGTPAGLWKADTITGRFFSSRARVSLPHLRPPPEKFLIVRNAVMRTLAGIDVPFPLERLTAVTGVSGSGKSTLVEDVLAASLAARKPLGCSAIDCGTRNPTAILVTQDPIGINPRSNPATYTGLAAVVRDLFSSRTGFSPSHFSFNRPEGACPACGGIGAIEMTMRFMPSVWIDCDECGGRRFKDEISSMEIDLGGRKVSIADVFQLSLAELRGILPRDTRDGKSAGRILDALCDIGLGYLSLGQPSPSLSGGEAQRVKLARYLGKPSLGKSLLIIDEPSTGLHPYDVAGLLAVFDRLVRSGATLIVVEHNPDIIRAADWVIDLGPGAGEEGGRLIYAGPVKGLMESEGSATGRALREEKDLKPGRPTRERERGRLDSSRWIVVEEAWANNLRGVTARFPKGKLTAVTGLSGSGKSSLVADVLEAEARKRFLETLSMYERQATKEGPETEARGVHGLGVSLSVTPGFPGGYNPRLEVGAATELSHNLAAVLAFQGRRDCPQCGKPLERAAEADGRGRGIWLCPLCGPQGTLPEPQHFMPRTYAAACPACHGVGSFQEPRPDKLIIKPDKPLCGGAMKSPGFFPQGYLCTPGNGGYDTVQALAARHGFDPATTPWNRMSRAARDAFLFGDKEPLTVTFVGKTGRTHVSRVPFRGFYGLIRDWDAGGTYTETKPCPECGGSRLRPEYSSVTLRGRSVAELTSSPLVELLGILRKLPVGGPSVSSLRSAMEKTGFLVRVGLGYLHLGRLTASLSAGEAQRVKLAGLLGSGLTLLTVILDEPSRGLHPEEVEALSDALGDLRDAGNTIIVVEHDLALIRRADWIIEMGPGAGKKGGRIVASGAPEDISARRSPTARWLRSTDVSRQRAQTGMSSRPPIRWLTIVEPRENNLQGGEARLPLGVLCGVCGVSGSGKSTLVVDTLGRALAPRTHTTSMSREPLDPGRHDAITGAPARAVVVDQARAGLGCVRDVLGLDALIRRLYAAAPEAVDRGLSPKDLGRNCTTCRGSGSVSIDMGFLPNVRVTCETCGGTGYPPEARGIELHGVSLPELMTLTVEEALSLWRDEERLSRPLQLCADAGLGYLVLRQREVSGGEAQRLKMVGELLTRDKPDTLYILDEPTVGLHSEDILTLVRLLDRVVDGGNSVLVIEHSPQFLSRCDWLVEMGPGAGPKGGRIIAQGSPTDLAGMKTPTARYLREALA